MYIYTIQIYIYYNIIYIINILYSHNCPFQRWRYCQWSSAGCYPFSQEPFLAVYARPFHEESGHRSPANWLKLPRLWDKRTPSWAGMIRDDWLWWKHGGLMSCYFCLGQIWVMIQHWKAYFSTSQPERCDYLCLVLTADPSTKLWGELTWINDPSSRVGWSQHVTVGHPELPGGRLPFRAPHRCLWRRLFDQCWDLALDLFVGGQGHAGACRGMQGHAGAPGWFSASQVSNAV